MRGGRFETRDLVTIPPPRASLGNGRVKTPATAGVFGGYLTDWPVVVGAFLAPISV
jgi:hypothetical protein